MAFKTIKSPITDLVSGGAEINFNINGSSFHLGLSVRSIIFYDDSLNVVIPTGAVFDVRCWPDSEDPNTYKRLGFYVTDLPTGTTSVTPTGTISHITDPLSGITKIASPIEKVKVLISGVTGATKIKVKLIIQKDRA